MMRDFMESFLPAPAGEVTVPEKAKHRPLTKLEASAKRFMGHISSDEEWKRINAEEPRMHRRTYEGLPIKILEGDPSLPTVILTNGLGVPGREYLWMHSFNAIGHNVVYAPFRGTWGAEGTFLAEVEDIGQLTDTVETQMRFAREQLFAEEFIGAGQCFGISPLLQASVEHPEMHTIIGYGPMIFGLGPKAEFDIRTDVRLNPSTGKLVQDKTGQLGQEIVAAQEPNWESTTGERPTMYRGYPRFSKHAWDRLTRVGNTVVAPANKDVQRELVDKNILLIHAQWDGLIHYARTQQFMRSLHAQARKAGIPEEEIADRLVGQYPDSPEGSHRGGSAYALDIARFTQPNEDPAKLGARMKQRVENHMGVISVQGQEVSFPFAEDIRKDYLALQAEEVVNPNLAVDEVVYTLNK